jgi:hypothetical protein
MEAHRVYESAVADSSGFLTKPAIRLVLHRPEFFQGQEGLGGAGKLALGSDERLATYTPVPAGTYTFRVQAATRRGQWGVPGVAPP